MNGERGVRNFAGRHKKFVTWISGVVALTVLAPTSISADPAAESKLVPHKVLNRNENTVLDKLALDIEVPLIDERLPSTKELSAIAEHLVGTPRHAKTWVLFYLPGMEAGAGAYASAHYLPEPEGVKLVPLALLNTNYEHLDPELRALRNASPE
jgi:hypothetical protein